MYDPSTTCSDASSRKSFAIACIVKVVKIQFVLVAMSNTMLVYSSKRVQAKLLYKILAIKNRSGNLWTVIDLHRSLVKFYNII